MILLVLSLIAPSFLVTFIGTILVRRISLSRGHLDTAGSPGHVKTRIRGVPNTGGIAIAAGIILPVVAGLVGVLAMSGVISESTSAGGMVGALSEHLPGVRERLPMLITLLICLVALHLTGVIDDRRPLGPVPKLLVQVITSFVIIYFFDTRLLTLLDDVPVLSSIAPWPSVLITLAWFIVITNAINFMDNMDGLAGGVAAIASGLFLVAACINEQWFVAALLAPLFGSLIAFLCFNFPPASIFMGDGGSLVIGFLLAFLTTRTTYYDPEAAGGWYGVLMPIVILAIPVYDLTSVVVLRLRQGKSPFVGDQQHFSHRFVMRGLTPRTAVLMIWGCTLVTGIGGVILSRVADWQAILIGVQTIVILAFIGFYEKAALGSKVIGDRARENGMSPSRDVREEEEQ